MDNSKLQLASFSVQELIDYLTPFLLKENQKFLFEISKNNPQNEIFNFNDLCVAMKRSPPNTKKAIIGYGIPPHIYEPDANPHYIKSEVFECIINSPTTKWFDERRKEFLSNMEIKKADSA
jgi:hypothetical protein